jgi:hypothetical protein
METMKNIIPSDHAQRLFTIGSRFAIDASCAQ